MKLCPHKIEEGLSKSWCCPEEENRHPIYDTDVIDAGKELLNLMEWRATELGRRYLLGAMEYLTDCTLQPYPSESIESTFDARALIIGKLNEITPGFPWARTENE